MEWIAVVEAPPRDDAVTTFLAAASGSSTRSTSSLLVSLPVAAALVATTTTCDDVLLVNTLVGGPDDDETDMMMVARALLFGLFGEATERSEDSPNSTGRDCSTAVVPSMMLLLATQCKSRLGIQEPKPFRVATGWPPSRCWLVIVDCGCCWVPFVSVFSLVYRELFVLFVLLVK